MGIRDISRLPPEMKERARARFHDPRQWKADQEWELAGLARRDGDHEAERRHTERARAILRGEDQ